MISPTFKPKASNIVPFLTNETLNPFNSFLTKDELLTNVCIYWFSEAITSSMRLYYETLCLGAKQSSTEKKGKPIIVTVPTGYAEFPYEIFAPPLAWVKKVYIIDRREVGKKGIKAKTYSKIPKKWDGKWRIVIFDLDESKKTIRDMLRSRLKMLEYVQLQRSVWISPYDTTDEIEQLQSKFQLNSDEFRLLEASTIGKDLGLKKHFNIGKK